MVFCLVVLIALFACADGFYSNKFRGSYVEKDVYHAGCGSKEPAFGPESTFSDPVSMIDNQVLAATVKNGKLYKVVLPNPGFGPNASQTIDIIHMWGTPYEQGEAHGQLMGVVAKNFVNDVWTYLEGQVEEVVKYVPRWLAKLVADFGLDVALDMTEIATRAFTPTGFYEVMRGLAAGCGLDYQRLVRVHMLAGLTQGKCSTVGLWGQALDPTISTKTMQLRALDWNMDGPFRNYAAVQVYHGSGVRNTFATVGFPGFVGALSGMNEHRMAISEIGVSYPDPSFGSESRIGVPFIFMLREVLEFDQTIAQSITRMQHARRTCDLILGVGDGKAGYVRGFQYSYSVCNVIGDTNFLPVNSSWHSPIADAVYWGMDWMCPTFNYVLGSQLNKFYGKITPLIARQNISAVEMSGDNHLVWYDLTNGVMWAAFASPNGVSGPDQAYWRQYLEIDTVKAFAETRPSKK